MIMLFIDPELTRHMIADENNLVELGTPGVLIPAVVYGILSLRKYRLLPGKRALIWIAMVTLASFYFAGEEISWGQQLFHWSTPEVISEYNDQHETNLHNTSSWFDQKPRIVLELWVLVGGIFMPLLNYSRKKKYLVSDWRYWFWPYKACFVPAFLAILVKMPDHLSDLIVDFVYGTNIRYSELQEFYFAYFLMVFLYATCRKLEQLEKPQ